MIMKGKGKFFLALAAAITVVILLTSAGGADKSGQSGAAAKDYSQHHVITCSSTFFLETGVNYMDAVAKELVKDLNISLEFVPIPLANAAEVCRIWISSGDMPDITSYGFTLSDYVQYAEQGLVRALPMDYETRYPHLARAIKASEIDAPLKKMFNGKLYAGIRPIFVNEILDKPYAEHTSLYYRKDWAQQCGLPVKTDYTIAEVMNMAKVFMEKDPNKNGPGKTIGFAVEPGNMIMMMLRPNFKWFNSIYKDNVTGRYEYGPFQQGALRGLETLRKYYDDKIIYQDFFTIKARGEVEAMLNSGLTGLMINGAAFGNVKRIFSAFEVATKLNALDTLELANVIGDDGKRRATVMMNHQSMNYFSPKMSDNKFERCLAFLDWAATDEMQDMINMGIPGKDWHKEGNQIVITRPKLPSGDFVPMGTYYPSYNLLSMIVIAWDDFTARDPSTNPKLLEKNIKMWNGRTREGDLALTDYDLFFYSSPQRDKISTINVGTEFTNVVMKGPNVKQNWDAFVNQFNPIVKEALDDINKNLLKK